MKKLTEIEKLRDWSLMLIQNNRGYKRLLSDERPSKQKRSEKQDES